MFWTRVQLRLRTTIVKADRAVATPLGIAEMYLANGFPHCRASWLGSHTVDENTVTKIICEAEKPEHMVRGDKFGHHETAIWQQLWAKFIWHGVCFYLSTRQRREHPTKPVTPASIKDSVTWFPKAETHSSPLFQSRHHRKFRRFTHENRRCQNVLKISLAEVMDSIFFSIWASQLRLCAEVPFYC